MDVIGWSKSSLLDYPGHICTTIFTRGCNYKCPWCHNKEEMNGDPKYEVSEIMEFLEERKGLLEAVVISGGEPTLQKDLLPFIESIKQLGYKVKLDTNGSNPDMVKRLIDSNLLDYIAMDYKSPLRCYPMFTGVENLNMGDVILTLAVIINSTVDYEIRTTVVPGLGFTQICEIAGELPRVKRYVLQVYRDSGVPSLKSMETISLAVNDNAVRKLQPNLKGRGMVNNTRLHKEDN